MQRFIKDLFSTPRLIIAAAVLTLAAPARAQIAPATIRLLPEDAGRGHYGHQHNFYFLPPGISGENYQSAGFFGQKLRPYLGTNAEALSSLAAYRRQKTLFLLDRFVGVGALGLYGSQVFAKDGEQQYFNSTQRVAAGLFAATLLATVAINRRTNEHLQQAVSAYNAGPPSPHAASWQRFTPSTIGLRSSATGYSLLALGWTLR